MRSLAMAGTSGVVAAYAGKEMTLSAAQAAPASSRFITIENLIDQCLAGSTSVSRQSSKKLLTDVAELFRSGFLGVELDSRGTRRRRAARWRPGGSIIGEG